MLALLGLATIVVLLTAIMTNRMSPLVALIAVPIVAALAGGFGLETSKFIIAGIRSIAPTAGMFVFAIIFFGVGDNAAIFLIFLGAYFPIVVACINGVDNVPSMYRRAGRNFGLTPAQLLTKVIFPAALPQIIIGLRIALGIAWLVVVAAEMIAVDSGLGYLIIDSRNSGKRYDLVVAAMLLIGVIGLLLDLAFRRLEKIKSVRWGFRNVS